MRLFTSDLFRNFGIGFLLGAVLVVGVNAREWDAPLSAPAQAAERAEPLAPTAEFVIAPQGR